MASNFHDGIQKSQSFKKFILDDLLFVEYSCEPGLPQTAIWSHSNYFTYVISGELILSTVHRDYILSAGQSYFVKKGGYVVPTFSGDTFCDLIIFITDDFIRDVLCKYEMDAKFRPALLEDSVLDLHMDETLSQYYLSLFSYFSGNKKPSKDLLRIKFEELIINLISDNQNANLCEYFAHLCIHTKSNISEVMEANFNSSISISDFARLCARSLSSFRRDFQQIYNQSPAKWLKEKRLHYSQYLLKNTNKSITDVIHESGFTNRSHFNRIFKTRFNITPLEMRKAAKCKI